MQETGAAAPEARMQRVLDHIHDNLGEALTLDRLSAMAALSKFHFHRRFAEWTGLPVGQYVQAARLKQAAFRLAYRGTASIAEIALDCGYQSPEAFARMFKQQTGQTPTGFRAAPRWQGWRGSDRRTSTPWRGRFGPEAVSIVTFPGTRLAVLSHDGPPETAGETIRRFIAWRRTMRLRPGTSATFNIFDPLPEAAGGYRLVLGAATHRAVADSEAGIGIRTIPAGRCALLRLTGSDDDLGPALAYLAGDWLRHSGAAARNCPPFAQRRSLFPDVPEGQAETDIYLPIR